MVDWKFSRRCDRCGSCDTVFEDGTRHVSTLSLKGEELSRADSCVACWEREAPSAAIFFWYTRQSRERRGLRLDLPTLEQLFLRLEGRTEERVLEMRYVLALLLMRKKRLKLVRIVRQPRETMVVRRPRREEALEVAVFDFRPERMEELRRELVEIFDGAEGERSDPAEGGEPDTREEAPPAESMAS
jgi:hypothetical protein